MVFFFSFAGGIKKGDQILKVNGKSLENITLSQAQELLWNAEQASGVCVIHNLGLVPQK